MATRVVTTAEQLTEVTKTGAGTDSYADAGTAVLTHTPSNNAKVLYIVSAEARVSVANADINIRFHHDTATTVLAECNYESKEASSPNDRFPFCVAVVVEYGASPGSNVLSIEYSNENTANTVGVGNARIVAIELGANDYFSAGSATPDTDATQSSFSDATSSSISVPDGEYVILGTLEGNENNTGERLISQVTIDATPFFPHEIFFKDAANWISIPFGPLKTTLSGGGSHTIKWQFDTQTTGATASARRARLIALKVSDWDGDYYTEERTEAGGTDATYQTFESLNPNIAQAGDHLIIAGWRMLNSSTTISSYSQLFDGTGAILEHVNEGLSTVTYVAAALVAYVDELAAGTGQTWSIQRKSETTGTTTSIDEASIVVLQIEADAGGGLTLPIIYPHYMKLWAA